MKLATLAIIALGLTGCVGPQKKVEWIPAPAVIHWHEQNGSISFLQNCEVGLAKNGNVVWRVKQ